MFSGPGRGIPSRGDLALRVPRAMLQGVAFLTFLLWKSRHVELKLILRCKYRVH
jgi:hypothetical protein